MQRLFRSAALCIAGCGRTQAPPEHTGRLRGSIAAEATGDGSVAKFRILVRMMDVITVAHLADSNATITAMSWSDDGRFTVRNASAGENPSATSWSMGLRFFLGVTREACVAATRAGLQVQ